MERKINWFLHWFKTKLKVKFVAFVHICIKYVCKSMDMIDRKGLSWYIDIMVYSMNILADGDTKIGCIWLITRDIVYDIAMFNSKHQICDKISCSWQELPVCVMLPSNSCTEYLMSVFLMQHINWLYAMTSFWPARSKYLI